MTAANRRIYQIAVFLAGLFFCVIARTNAQDSIAVGEKVPDLLFTNLINYPKSSLRLSDFEGKPLILDFWGTFCVPCVKNMPKVDTLQRRFEGKLQILLMGVDGENKIRPLYENLMRRHNGFSLPTAIIEQSVYKRFGVFAVPQYAWIDKTGVLLAMTDDKMITADHLNVFAATGSLPFEASPDAFRQPNMVDMSKPLIGDVSGGEVIPIYYSALMPAKENTVSAYGYFAHDSLYRNRRITATNFSPTGLYSIAYGNSGKAFPYNRTVIELEDSVNLSLNSNEDNYCYDLIVPARDSLQLHQLMQQDLSRYFGWDARVEKRPVNCYVLRRVNDAPIPVTTDTASVDWNISGIMLKNQPISRLVGMIGYYMQGSLPIIDETHYSENIDVDFNCLMYDPKEVRKELQRYGLDLAKEVRELDILLLSGPVDDYTFH